VSIGNALGLPVQPSSEHIAIGADKFSPQAAIAILEEIPRLSAQVVIAFGVYDSLVQDCTSQCRKTIVGQFIIRDL